MKEKHTENISEHKSDAGFTDKQGSKKKLVIIILAAVLVLAAGVLIFILLSRDKGYRVLKVYEVEGDAEVTREGTGAINPYVNMNLESGDRIKLNTGTFNIRADEDKYIYLEEHTELILEATGTAKNSRTKIQLLTGAITNDIRNKLSDDSSYEINTPNSSMSVLGTVYYVAVYEENGVTYTKVAVFDGSVSTRLTYPDGKQSAETVLVPSGQETLIYYDGQTTDYVSPPKDIDYNEIPDEVLRILDKITDDDRDLSITKEEITKLLEGPFIVTFMYGDNEFGKQSVKKGGLVTVPKLSPAPEGSWDYDFNTPVDRDIIIRWKDK